MGGFLGIGNSSAKTDRGNQLAGVNASWNVYNRGLPMGEDLAEAGTKTTTDGLSTLDKVKSFWQSMKSGFKPPAPKTEVMQSAGPAIDIVNQQADAAQNEAAQMGTSRTGGTAEANQMAKTEQMGEVNEAVRDATTGIENRAVAAVTGLQNAGEAETRVGAQQMSQALQALGLSAEVAQEIIDSSIQSRPISMKANEAVRQQWSQALAALGL